MTPLKVVQGKAEHVPLEPWELEFLKTGDEPDNRHSLLFSLTYETGDWKNRWKAVEDALVRQWTEVPEFKRPVSWIRYLMHIGYLPEKKGRKLIPPNDPDYAAVV